MGGGVPVWGGKGIGFRASRTIAFLSLAWGPRKTEPSAYRQQRSWKHLLLLGCDSAYPHASAGGGGGRESGVAILRLRVQDMETRV